MRELLIRYLMGELDWDQQRDVEAKLEKSPELRRELAHLKSCFLPSDDPDELDDAPRGLAERTAGRICDEAYDQFGDRIEGRPAVTRAPVDPSPSSPQWSLADLTVAGGVCLAVSMLLFPALRDSRDAGRRLTCTNNLRDIGVTLTLYGERSGGGMYPRIGPYENAGTYVTHLIASGTVLPEVMAVRRLCPGSPTAGMLRNRAFVWRLPTEEEARGMSPAQIYAIKRQMSPSYGYRLPYQDGNRLRYLPDRGDRFIAVMTDTPNHANEDYMPENHGGLLQVLFQDNHVGTQRRMYVADEDDNFFINDRGEQGPGCDPNDTVIVRSEVSPRVVPAQYDRVRMVRD